MVSKNQTSEKPFKCEYCNAGFSRETTIAAHMCQPKKRAVQKNEKRVQIGFYAFNRFYKLSANAKENKTYEEFSKSPFYNAFVKFGSFVNNVKPLYPERYIDHVVTSQIKIDKWCDDSIYEKYVIDLILRENSETALERTVITMNEWAQENSSIWNLYFKQVSVNRAVWHIKDGKVSPWLILNSKTGKEMISRLNDEQLNMIYPVMNPDYWGKKFKNSLSDMQLVKQIVKEGNL